MTEDQPTRWGRYVKAVLDKHGLNSRSQRLRTGIPHSTVNGWMKFHVPPRKPNALTFIRGMGEDEAAGLREAGFGDEPEHTGSETLISGISALQQELGRPILISFDHSIRAGLSVEEAEELLAHIRQQAEAGVF